MTFCYGSGFSDSNLCLTNNEYCTALDPDPALFVRDLQDANKNYFFFPSFLLIKVPGTFWNQVFLYYFCFMMGGSGSVPPTYESEYGSRRPPKLMDPTERCLQLFLNSNTLVNADPCVYTSTGAARLEEYKVNESLRNTNVSSYGNTSVRKQGIHHWKWNWIMDYNEDLFPTLQVFIGMTHLSTGQVLAIFTRWGETQRS